MALTNCARCGHLVSTKAPKCPGCGTPPPDNPITVGKNPGVADARPNPPGDANAPSASPRPYAAPVKSASSESSGQAGGRRFGIEGSRLSIDLSNWKLLLSLGVVIVLAWWWLIYLPGTPSYAIWSLNSALSNQNGAAAARFIDFQKVTRNVVMRDMNQKAAAAKSPEERQRLLLKETIGGGLLDLFAQPLARIARGRFEKIVDTSHDNALGIIDLLDALVNLHWTGANTAATRVYDQNGKAVDVTLARENGNWRITDLSGPAVRDEFRKLRKERPVLPAPPPSPSSPDQSHREPSV